MEVKVARLIGIISKRAPELTKDELEHLINKIDIDNQYLIRVTNDPMKFNRYLLVRDKVTLIIPKNCSIIYKGEGKTNFDVNTKYVVTISSKDPNGRDMLAIYIPKGEFQPSPEVKYIKENFNIENLR